MIAYTMPVWASLLAWPVLGERLTLLRMVALVMAFAGLAAIMGGNGIRRQRATSCRASRMALVGAFGFALGTVLAEAVAAAAAADRRPRPGRSGSAACRSRSSASLIETPHLEALTELGWTLLVYSTVIQFCIAYVCWFAALARLPASVAAIGTMAVPVIGVVASAVALRRAARARPDRGAGVHAGRRGAGDAVLSARETVSWPTARAKRS